MFKKIFKFTPSLTQKYFLHFLEIWRSGLLKLQHLHTLLVQLLATRSSRGCSKTYPPQQQLEALLDLLTITAGKNTHSNSNDYSIISFFGRNSISMGIGERGQSNSQKILFHSNLSFPAYMVTYKPGLVRISNGGMSTLKLWACPIKFAWKFPAGLRAQKNLSNFFGPPIAENEPAPDSSKTGRRHIGKKN